MSKMRKFRFLWLILLVLIVTACSVFGPRTFNEDGSDASPFSFEYPPSWEVLHDNGSTWAFKDAEEIEFSDDGQLTGFFAGTVGVGVTILTPEMLVEEYGASNMLPAEMMDEKYEEFQAMWQASQEGDLEELNRLNGLVSVINQPPVLVPNVYEPPTAVQYCDKEVVVMKAEDYITSPVFSPFRKSWWGLTIIDDQVIQIVALADQADEETFAENFESIICSLEVHKSE